MSEESIKPPDTPHNNAATKLVFIHHAKIAVTVEGSCLKQDKIPFNCKNVVNVIFYELEKWSYNWGADFTLGDSLFETVKSTKNADSDKYGYRYHNGCGIGFDAHTRFLLPCNGLSKTIIFVGDNTSSAQVDDRKRDILIFGISPTNGPDDATITAEVQYSIKLLNQEKNSMTVLATVFCMLMA